MLVDAHAHIDRYTDRLAEAIRQIDRTRSLTVCVSMNITSYLATKRISTMCEYLLPCFGVHPWEAHHYEGKLKELDAHLKTTPLIGEAGLDFHFIKDSSQYRSQHEVFEYQCAWAQRNKLSMNLHTKGAEREVLSAIREYRIVSPIIHWYSGPTALIDEYLQLGCYFTIGVEVLRSEHIQRIAQIIPIDRLLLETDNPGGYKWLHNIEGMPATLLEVLARVSEVRKAAKTDLEERIHGNWMIIAQHLQ